MRAKSLGITGYRRMRKAELVKAIAQREHSQEAAERRERAQEGAERRKAA